MRESGGALAKLLVVLVLIALLVSAGLYVYGTRQQPLELGDAVPARANVAHGSSVRVDADGVLRVATVLRNGGRLPVTIEGLDEQPRGPLVATSLRLGDGRDATATAAFTPTELAPGSGVGVVIVFTLDPAGCSGLRNAPTAAMPFPPVTLRFSSFGVTSTQSLQPPDAPKVIGVTRDLCEAS